MEIIPQVHYLTLGLTGVNMYILLDNTLTLVDTGMPGESKRILGYLRQLGYTPADLKQIIVTHHHLDHTGSLAELRQQTAARIWAHPYDAPFITGERRRPPPRGIVWQWLYRLVPAMSRYTPAPVDVLLNDGDTLDLLGGAMVIHVPGHTAGSIALHLPGERVLFTGDALRRHRHRLSGPPAPFTEDAGQASQSLHRLAALDFEVLCPGHGAPIVGGADQQVRCIMTARSHGTAARSGSI